MSEPDDSEFDVAPRPTARAIERTELDLSEPKESEAVSLVLVEPEEEIEELRTYTTDELNYIVAKRLGQEQRKLERRGVKPPPIPPPRDLILLTEDMRIEKTYTADELNAEVKERLRQYQHLAKRAPRIQPDPPPAASAAVKPRSLFSDDAARRVYIGRRY